MSRLWFLVILAVSGLLRCRSHQPEEQVGLLSSVPKGPIHNHSFPPHPHSAAVSLSLDIPCSSAGHTSQNNGCANSGIVVVVIVCVLCECTCHSINMEDRERPGSQFSPSDLSRECGIFWFFCGCAASAWLGGPWGNSVSYLTVRGLLVQMCHHSQFLPWVLELSGWNNSYFPHWAISLVPGLRF